MKKYIIGFTALFASTFAFANECATTVESNDAMQFNTSKVTIPASCDEFTVTLKHTGALPKQSMGHNWVMTKKADAQAVASDGVSAGLDNNYLKPNDERVIGATEVIGGGQETSTTFSVAELDKEGEYMFFCSFPGHISLMKGTVTFGS
ncbi:azurin [Alteromonas sp. 345S023]|uniref:Azurin n=2 Tax=Alteromonas profundi TaxID=2696062 RepID=A0A7X5LJ44_9ALTE|nr:azurin [Alteromonas profundi]